MEAIPRIIHQTYKTADIPAAWEKSRSEWQKMHPTWEYRFWTDADNLELITSRYPQYLTAYNSFLYPIQRVDFARVAILDTYGGVYSDLDMYPVAAIDEYLSAPGVEAFFVASGNTTGIFTNSFMASHPGASVWSKLLAEMVKPAPWWAIFKHLHIMTTTGPLALDRTLKNLADNTVGYLPRRRFKGYTAHESDAVIKPGTVLAPLPGSSWCSWDSFMFVWMNQHMADLAVVGVCALVIGAVALIVVSVLAARSRYMLSECRRGRKLEP